MIWSFVEMDGSIAIGRGRWMRIIEDIGMQWKKKKLRPVS